MELTNVECVYTNEEGQIIRHACKRRGLFNRTEAKLLPPSVRTVVREHSSRVRGRLSLL